MGGTMTYRVYFTDSARKQVENLSGNIRNTVAMLLKDMKRTPIMRRRGGKQLVGRLSRYYQYTIGGSFGYRMLLDIYQKQVWIICLLLKGPVNLGQQKKFNRTLHQFVDLYKQEIVDKKLWTEGKQIQGHVLYDPDDLKALKNKESH